LVELTVFIVIVSVAVAGVLTALNLSARASADPMTQKQALAIAEALLEEVELRSFTFCDPDDANAATATSTAGCAATVEAMGPEAGETRTGVTPFDNVNDYFVAGTGLVLTGISDLTGAAIAGLASYTATITVATQALGGIAGTDAGGAPQSLLITVTVTGPAAASVRLDGYRVRYAPNALP
jgi:MSHA pilin protein MshD